jgi:nucleotide-binding universal stress UspA family protein
MADACNDLFAHSQAQIRGRQPSYTLLTVLVISRMSVRVVVDSVYSFAVCNHFSQQPSRGGPVMLPIKKIVCPTDFSEPSYKGIDTGIELAQHFDAELILVNVVSPMPLVPGAHAPTGFHIPTVMNDMQAGAESSINELIEEKVPGEMRARSTVVQGKPADEIVRIAAEENADMIVISTHGESGWQKFLFGSVAEKTIRTASCPVLTVRQSEKT